MVDTLAQLEAEENAATPYDASDPKQVNEARIKSGRRKRTKLEFVQAIMVVPEGRTWMYELLDFCHIYDNPLVKNDTHFTYFRLGEENIGKMILSDVMSAAPEEYLLMLKENKKPIK